ncbi:hypothetical protein [Acetanaerobacterium elongatum]|uniref:Uncharacterized protein n=1 Tax=Acetanaerobacterium elongatum TaxID=258515 RepID=A0A1G9TZ97_9FIRM|nr:hypothetical protein [Acetanaerobacterium elongatum]SDM52744.1 hypothetical protein SAMN05192585_10122 [Acetanaerobacterium elongatum]
MNNLVFNTTAAELKTSVYAQKSDDSFAAIQIDNSGNLYVNVSNTSLTVAGSVTINNTDLSIAGDVTITNTSLTVAGSVTINNTDLSVAGDVTITNTSLTVAGSVTVNNATITTFVNGSRLTTITLSSSAVTSNTILLDNSDISQYKNAAFMLYNESTATLVTLNLQVSPTDTTTDYITDTTLGTVTLAANGKLYIPVSVVGKNVRLLATSASDTVTVNGYYVAQA